MKLLTFAHRGEAQTFFKELELKPIQGPIEGLYKSEDFFLLITGEGIQETTQKVSATLGAHSHQITEILNLGVCGALNKDFSKGEIYCIRTAYSESGDEIDFKSFSTSDSEGVDIITSNKRVLSKGYADYLESFAPLVDRELWAIGSCSKLFGLPFRAFKLVSDEVGDTEICQVVKEKSLEYSEKLFQLFLGFSDSEETQPSKDYTIPEQIHLTLSMKRNLESILHSLEVKYEYSFEESLSKANIDNIMEDDSLPKAKGKKLLENLAKLLNPYRFKVLNELNSYFSEFKTYEIGFRPHKDLDNNNLTFQFMCKDQMELNSKLLALKRFDFEKYARIIIGKEDV